MVSSKNSESISNHLRVVINVVQLCNNLNQVRIEEGKTKLRMHV